jgi:hypothetical protein
MDVGKNSPQKVAPKMVRRRGPISGGPTKGIPKVGRLMGITRRSLKRGSAKGGWKRVREGVVREGWSSKGVHRSG